MTKYAVIIFNDDERQSVNSCYAPISHDVAILMYNGAVARHGEKRVIICSTKECK